MRTFLAACVLSSAAIAQTIDFESIPGLRGEGPDGLQIRDQYNVAPWHVRFERVDPVGALQPLTLTRVGAPRTAFRGETQLGCDGRNTQDDMPNKNVPFAAGCYFVTDDGQWGSGSPGVQPYVVRYSVPVLQASGYVLDLDDAEEFTIHARDANEVDVAAPIVLDRHSATPGNGGASFWFFDVQEPIHSILFDYTGHGGSKGTGMDEFSPASACPAQMVHHGNGIPGTGNQVPALSVSCLRIGSPGSIEVFNAPGGVLGSIAVALDGTTRALFCGNVLANTPFIRLYTTSGTPGVPGVGRHSQFFGPVSASLAGVKVFFQAGFRDPGAPCRHTAFTEIVEVTVR